MTSPSRPGPARRRQRSTRVVIAGSLLLVALLAVAGGALSGSWLVATLTAVLAVALGATGTRITYSELVDSRRQAAGDRAEQAQGYLALTETRTAEQAIYVAESSGRIARHQSMIDRLESRLADAAHELAEARRVLEAERARADEATSESARLRRRLDEADERAAQAIVRVAELEQELDIVLAEWRAGSHAPQHKQA